MPKRLLLAALLALAGCDAFSADESVPFARLTVPTERVLVNGTTVIRDQRTLASFASALPDDPGPIFLPEVDFEQQMVLGVFYGGSLHAGCLSEVEVIESARRDGDRLVVTVGPLPDLGPCRAVVYPFQFVVVDATAWDVRFTGHLPR